MLVWYIDFHDIHPDACGVRRHTQACVTAEQNPRTSPIEHPRLLDEWPAYATRIPKAYSATNHTVRRWFARWSIVVTAMVFRH